MQITKKLSDDITLGFEWEGGPYIQVCIGQAYRKAYEVINVWNYAEGKARIPFTRESLHAKVNEWIYNYDRENLIHDVTENWPYL